MMRGSQAYFAQFAQGWYKIGPFARVLEVLQGLVDVWHVVAILGFGEELLLLDEGIGHRIHPPRLPEFPGITSNFQFQWVLIESFRCNGRIQTLVIAITTTNESTLINSLLYIDYMVYSVCYWLCIEYWVIYIYHWYEWYDINVIWFSMKVLCIVHDVIKSILETWVCFPSFLPFLFFIWYLCNV